MRGRLQRLQSVCVVEMTALALCGCGRLQDDFRGDNDPVWMKTMDAACAAIQ